ncbi:MAG TPA: DNA polymerase III subunit delta' [Candidatus Polarisedimenticolia bacterium]|nr:DNA polymerase III subunit delta' [Candidatus Polarisedimenticolia bacterium]
MVTLHTLVGHEQPVRVLTGAIAAGRLHHALLFHGPEAVGKRTAALAAAASLLCQDEARPEGGACGRCPACNKVDKGIHPDLKYVTLEKTVVPIDAIRALRQEAGYRPFEGRCRVFIIDPAERMSHEAQNALLKTLEEPPPAAFLILVTSRPAQLLPTTRSRCQAIAFGTMPPDELASLLRRERGLDEPGAWRAARLASGRYGAAMELDLETHDAAREEMIQVLERLSVPGSRRHVLDDAERLGTDTVEIAARLDVLEGLLRDMMLLGWGAPPVLLLSADRAEELETLARRLSSDPSALVAMMERVAAARSDLDRNVQRKLLAETLLFDLARTGGTG